MELSEMIDEFKQNDHSNFNLFYELTHKQVFFSSFTNLCVFIHNCKKLKYKLLQEDEKEHGR